MSNSTASYKQQKEDFVSGLTGGPVGEIVAVTAVLPVSQSQPLSSPATKHAESSTRLPPSSGQFCRRANHSSSPTQRSASLSTTCSMSQPHSSPSRSTPTALCSS